MNAIHSIVSAIFDVVVLPFEWMGDVTALVVVSGLFGILALLVFKRISWQEGIKSTKDKIKGHMIAIRIYQDDLAIVFGAVAKVLLRNVQYLALNFGPILPLFVPFVLIAAQLVVRYAFAPLPVTDEATARAELPGRGTMLEIRMKPGREAEVQDLELTFPAHLIPLSPVARTARDGLAVVEFAAIAPGAGDVEIEVGGELAGTKMVVAGQEAPARMQPERVSSFFVSWLWPAEPTFPTDSPVDYVRFSYPERDLGFLPGGPFGVLVTFFLASIVFGAAVLKPLNIQI